MKNISQNMHFLCFDTINPAGNSAKMKMINYGGSNQPFSMEQGNIYNDDGTVTLEYFNPIAKEVKVKYRLHNYKNSSPEYRKDPKFYSKDYVYEQMKRNEEGYWYATINPGPGFHSIYFIADGIVVVNPLGSYGYDGFGVRNFVDLSDDADIEIHDVPHGSITREIYYSAVTNRYRACWVYTPASYHVGNKKFPTLYIQHGGAQDEVCWFQSGKLDMILDNLIAKGEAEEMIVVANNGYAFKEIEDGLFIEKRLDDIIVEDCIPFIESRYRVSKDRRDRAVAGLSMGGGHARRIGFDHTDKFANVGMFSSGECFPTVTEDRDFTELFGDSERFNKEMDVVYVTCGDADPRYDKTIEDLKPLQERGLNIEFKGYKGQHEWNVWRYSAKDFVKKIFKR